MQVEHCQEWTVLIFCGGTSQPDCVSSLRCKGHLDGLVEHQRFYQQSSLNLLVNHTAHEPIPQHVNHDMLYRLVSIIVPVSPFNERVGPKEDLPDSPLGIFSLFFTPEVIDHIVTETNWYAAECLKDTNKEWKTNSEEIRVYLGFTVLMGIVRELEMWDYWMLSPFLHYSPIARKN